MNFDGWANRLLEMQEPLKGTWIILIDGQRITTRSRKADWPSKGAAKNALRHEFRAISCSLRRKDRTMYEAMWSDFISRRVEFKEIR